MSPNPSKVLRHKDIAPQPLLDLLNRYGLAIVVEAHQETLRGSFWGGDEAGLIGNELIISNNTPIHSILHEAGHYICMDKSRRSGLHTNAGGDYDEENAVCYLQILLADELPEMNQERMFEDMDDWGYSFRLGSAKAWFHEDAEDALDWLLKFQLINQNHRPNWNCRA